MKEGIEIHMNVKRKRMKIKKVTSSRCRGPRYGRIRGGRCNVGRRLWVGELRMLPEKVGDARPERCW